MSRYSFFNDALTLQAYMAFHSVAKYGSLSVAAEHLNSSQPALSKKIKHLEEQLGFQLFVRKHNGMVLTETGRNIFPMINDAFAQISEVQNALKDLRTQATGTIRIGATDAIFEHLLSDKIAAFHKKYINVKFDLIAGTTPKTINQLKNNRCDIAFLNMPIGDDDIKCRPVLEVHDTFIASEKYNELKSEELPLKQLTDYPLIMLETDTVSRKYVTDFSTSMGVRLSPEIEVSNYNLILELTKMEIGLGCVPREYMQDAIEKDGLFEVRVSPPLPVRHIGMALPENAPVSFALHRFIELFDWCDAH